MYHHSNPHSNPDHRRPPGRRFPHLAVTKPGFSGARRLPTTGPHPPPSLPNSTRGQPPVTGRCSTSTTGRGPPPSQVRPPPAPPAVSIPSCLRARPFPRRTNAPSATASFPRVLSPISKLSASHTLPAALPLTADMAALRPRLLVVEMVTRTLCRSVRSRHRCPGERACSPTRQPRRTALTRQSVPSVSRSSKWGFPWRGSNVCAASIEHVSMLGGRGTPEGVRCISMMDLAIRFCTRLFPMVFFSPLEQFVRAWVWRI